MRIDAILHRCAALPAYGINPLLLLQQRQTQEEVQDQVLGRRSSASLAHLARSRTQQMGLNVRAVILVMDDSLR